MDSVMDPKLTDAHRAWRSVPPGVLAAIVIAAAGALRLAAFFTALDDPYLQFRQGDEIYYHEWARAILGGQWSRGAPFFTTPLYAYFLAVAYLIGGQGIAYIRFLNVLMGIGTVLLVYLTAQRLIGPRAAIVATALLGFCSAPVYYEWFPDKTSLVLLLTAFASFLIARASTGGRLLTWLAAGFVSGVACLGHTLLLVALPAVWVHVALNRGGMRGAAARALALYSLGFALGLSPATMHNWLQDGSFVPVCTTGGITFYLGNWAGNSTGRYSSPPFASSNASSEEHDFIAEARRRTGRPLKPDEASAFWFRQAWVEIGADPGLSLRRFWRRFRWSLGDAENTDSRTFEFYQERHRFLRGPVWGFGLVSLLGLAGIGSARSRPLAFHGALIAFFAAGISLILVYGRYRLPLLVPLSLLAAAGLARVVAWVRQRRVAPLAAAGLAAAGLAWFVYAPVLPGYPVDFFTDYNNQGNRYWDLRQFERAIAEYDKALHVRPGINPTVPRLYLGLGRIFASRGELQRAEVLLREGVARYPGDRDIARQLEEVLRRVRTGS
jgi:4-amino-4-deoxy-L-arabinose transferase-like glycosyltransferase